MMTYIVPQYVAMVRVLLLGGTVLSPLLSYTEFAGKVVGVIHGDSIRVCKKIGDGRGLVYTKTGLGVCA
jgi:hypothetical protein